MDNRKFDINVSVSIVTYNQEKFIEQAIESVLMQKTNFDFEILIGEDDSSDGTREIVKRYGEKYTDRIKLFLNTRDQVVHIDGRPTGRRNFINNIKNARGRYIAILEGDDYWTDPLKLQKQADFLDSRPDFSLCFHWAEWFNQDSGKFREEKKGPPTIKNFYSTDDLLEYNNFLATCSVMFRNGLFEEFPSWYWEVSFGDFALHFLNASFGKIGFLNESMSVYRNHGGSIYGGSDPIYNLRRGLKTLSFIASRMGLKSRDSYRTGILQLQFLIFDGYRRARKWMPAVLFGMKIFLKVPFKKKLGMIMKLIKKISGVFSVFKNEKS